VCDTQGVHIESSTALDVYQGQGRPGAGTKGRDHRQFDNCISTLFSFYNLIFISFRFDFILIALHKASIHRLAIVLA